MSRRHRRGDRVGEDRNCGVTLTQAVQTLTERATEVRRLYAAHEVRIHGREWTERDLMDGFVVDVGDLMRLVMAKAGVRTVEDVDEKLAHELADCLWSVLVLAERLDVDLGAAFEATMDHLERDLTGGDGQ